MPDIENVINGLEHCLARYIDGLCDDCLYMGKLDKSYMLPMKCKEIMMRDALVLLKEQQIEIERLKGELKAECKNAEHDAYGCLGYGKSSQNDELIEKCKNCEKYTGNITGADTH